jgi:nucleotide-binding universal stress UspA family protein
MGPLSRIVLPVDFSERSAGAARYAKALAGHFHSELILLHVLVPPQYEFGALDIGGSMLAELYHNQAEQASAEMEAFVATELAGVEVRRVVLEGDPARRIVDFASTEHADLILMPTHGYGPFRRFILGSNTAKVLHDADCPVWTGVHMEEGPAPPPVELRRVLCAVDLGPQSPKALCWAAQLSASFGARLILLHAANAEPDSGDDSEVNWRVDVRAAAGRELERLQSFARVEAERMVETGEPAKAICSAAARIGADVLVIGRGSAAGHFGRLRTNAYAIIRGSPCPVVSV